MSTVGIVEVEPSITDTVYTSVFNNDDLTWSRLFDPEIIWLLFFILSIVGFIASFLKR